ncbi:phosphoacetylglucosamine mutase-like [Corylus avellana]|uniref:phosphoacetylglucosamine mutase-like n=1 Tax=Corylus avellana TaxID=13451 RepID=UPI00286B0E99|nr:phosphoacetylglucosamine mutase-like [Corylus avellana]
MTEYGEWAGKSELGPSKPKFDPTIGKTEINLILLPFLCGEVKVVDRTAVITANVEIVVVRPPGIQEALNAKATKYRQGRSFIQPSGSEDVIVYAEASTQEAADSLANSVARPVALDHFPGFGSIFHSATKFERSARVIIGPV